jgi:WD40 repeat protein
MLRPDMTQSTDPRAYQRPRFPVRTIRRVIWLLKIFFVPILATVGLLYGLMLYLLRGAQLLDARHDRPNEGIPECTNTEPPIDENVSFATLPRGFPTDIELIATSDDGRRVAAVGTQNEFVIWNMRDNERQSYITTDATDLLMRTSGTPSSQNTITALTLSGDGSMCAVGTCAGTVFVWGLGKSGIDPVPRLSTENSSFPVTGLQFSATGSSRGPLRLLATYENGVAAEWWTDGTGCSREITPSRPPLTSKCGIVPSSAKAKPTVAFFMEDGTLELCAAFQDSFPTPDFCVAAGNPSDHVLRVHVADLQIGGQARSIVAAATRAGVISIWDGETGECITILDDIFGETSGLRLSPVKSKTCQFCGEMVFDSFLLSFSVGQTVVVYRAYLMEGSTRKCSCPQTQPQRTSNVGVEFSPLKKKRSRQNSAASSGTSSPQKTRSRHPSLSGTISSGVLPTFPVSGHGVHSRRVSEKDKDSLRRAVELVVLPVPSFEREGAEESPSDGHARTYTSLTAGRSHVWENLVAVRVAVANFERGKWEVVDEKVVGLRRRPLKAGKPSDKWSIQLKPGSASGLSPASLERWELWTFDPLVGKTHASSLASLKQEDRDDFLTDFSRFEAAFSIQNSIAFPEPIPRLPFTRISSFLCRGNRCLAGFGNTIGVLRLNTPQVLQRQPSRS